MRLTICLAFAGVSLAALSGQAFAQGAPADGASDDSEIIVQARRKDESIQDVPLTVNAVSSETIDKLNIRELKDITSVVPGLVLSPGNRTTGSVSSLRGLNVDNNSSGNNGTVEFYLNDAPISGGAVLQAMYDIGQVEVLRGPQGTLRGRASPSGSITITTRKADMDEFGGYAQGTLTDIGGRNVQGAVNLPIVRDFLALRVAGLYEKNEVNRVESTNAPGWDSSAKTKSYRASLRFTPTSDIDFNVTYSRLIRNSVIWDQVESANLATGAALPAGSALITGRDRLAVSNVPNIGRQAFSMFNMQGQYTFAGQRLNYVGSITKQNLKSTEPLDKGDFYTSAYPGNLLLSNNNGTYRTLPSTLNLQNLAQAVFVHAKLQTHELRLSSDERILGMFDYVVGGLVSKQTPWTDLVNVARANFTGTVSPGTFTGFVASPILRRGRTLERAVFGNLTVHLGEATEVSGGVRRLSYQENLNGANNKFNATIWTASAKHRFNESLMVYATAGSSFRVGSGTNALILQRNINVNTVVDPFLRTLLPITPERSKSYEAGFRSNFLDNRLTLNVSAFYQKFNGYIFPVAPFYVLNNPTGASTVPNTNANVVLTVSSLAAPVPATVKGIEAELGFKPFDGFNLGATIAYAKSKMSNALIPCTPPGSSTPPTAAQINLTGTQQVGQCTVNQSAGRIAPFSGTFQAEYAHPIGGSYSGFVRGLAQVLGNSKNDPQNPYDDVKAYAIANLYAGVRADDSGWEISAYAKNLFNTFRVIDRSAVPATVTTSLGTRLSNYRTIATTQPREFGITAKYAFGSR